MCHDVAAVGDAEREADVLLDHQHACARLVRNFADDREHALDDDRCKTEAHFVDQQHLWLGGKAAGHGEHLLLATRQQARTTVDERPQCREHCEGVFHGCRTLCAVGCEPESQVLLNGEVEEERAVFGHVGHTATRNLVGTFTDG